MPIGIIIMRWDDLVGNVIENRYPQEINVTDQTLMHVYSTHEYSGDMGIISLMVGSLNIASYYTGPDKGIYILLLMNLDEDPDAYEGGLADASRTILQALEDDSVDKVLPDLYRRLAVYPTLNMEQQLAITYQDEIKRKIINRLREEGVVSKSELMIWLKDKFKEGFVDIDGVIIDLVKREIIKEASVKGMLSELVFLINDIVMIRVPPLKLLTNPADRGLPEALVQDYKTESKKFFTNYQPTDEDNLSIIEIFNDPQVYETLRLLRTAIVTKNDLEKLKKKGVDEIDEVLKRLWGLQLVHVFRDEQNVEYYGLIGDFHIDLMFPKYQFQVIKAEYEQKSKANKVLIEYVKVLQDAYYTMRSAKKSAKKEKKSKISKTEA
ncbi:MAG: hypothetical protein ACFFBP_06085 [Promethearchaeota archaeon]